MNMIGRLTFTIGLAVLIVVGFACGAEEKQVSAIAGPASDTQQAQGQTGASGLPVENTSPVVPAGAPLMSLTYEGVVYYGDSLSADEAANFNEDDFEFVGVSESNPLVPGSAAGWDMYRLKGGEEGYIYTLEPGRSFLNEDGRTITIEPEWSRWIADDPRPICTPTPNSSAAC